MHPSPRSSPKGEDDFAFFESAPDKMAENQKSKIRNQK
jgi:hypothetical protein